MRSRRRTTSPGEDSKAAELIRPDIDYVGENRFQVVNFQGDYDVPTVTIYIL